MSGAEVSMAKHELQVELNKIKSLATQITDAIEDYRACLLGLGAKDEDGQVVQLTQRHQADLQKTEAECGRRLDEVCKAVQEVIWAQNVKAKIKTKFLEAEAACDSAHERMGPKQLEKATELIQEASASLVDCETWILYQQTAHLKNKVATLTSVRNRLKAKMAVFLTAQRIAEGEMKDEPQPAEVPQAMVPQPGVSQSFF